MSIHSETCSARVVWFCTYFGLEYSICKESAAVGSCLFRSEFTQKGRLEEEPSHLLFEFTSFYLNFMGNPLLLPITKPLMESGHPGINLLQVVL